jgi:hypothetical protein
MLVDQAMQCAIVDCACKGYETSISSRFILANINGAEC